MTGMYPQTQIPPLFESRVLSGLLAVGHWSTEPWTTGPTGCKPDFAIPACAVLVMTRPTIITALLLFCRHPPVQHPDMCTHTYVYTHVHSYTCVFTYTRTRIRAYAYTNTRMRAPCLCKELVCTCIHCVSRSHCIVCRQRAYISILCIVCRHCAHTRLPQYSLYTLCIHVSTTLHSSSTLCTYRLPRV